MAQPLCFLSPCQFLFASLLFPLYLLGNPPWRDRILSTLVPGYSWTNLPFLNPSPFQFPASLLRFPQHPMLIRTRTRSRLPESETSTMGSQFTVFAMPQSHSSQLLLYSKGAVRIVCHTMESQFTVHICQSLKSHFKCLPYPVVTVHSVCYTVESQCTVFAFHRGQISRYLPYH